MIFCGDGAGGCGRRGRFCFRGLAGLDALRNRTGRAVFKDGVFVRLADGFSPRFYYGRESAAVQVRKAQVADHRGALGGTGDAFPQLTHRRPLRHLALTGRGYQSNGFVRPLADRPNGRDKVRVGAEQEAYVKLVLVSVRQHLGGDGDIGHLFNFAAEDPLHNPDAAAFQRGKNGFVTADFLRVRLDEVAGDGGEEENLAQDLVRLQQRRAQLPVVQPAIVNPRRVQKTQKAVVEVEAVNVEVDSLLAGGLLSHGKKTPGPRKNPPRGALRKRRKMRRPDCSHNPLKERESARGARRIVFPPLSTLYPFFMLKKFRAEGEVSF